MVGLGKTSTGVCGAENWDTSKESVREAISGRTWDSAQTLLLITWSDCLDFLAKICVCSAGCRLLQDLELKHVEVDACGDAQSAAEGAVLGLFHYDQLKSKKKTKVTTQLHGRYNHTNLLVYWCLIHTHASSYSRSSYTVCPFVFLVLMLLPGTEESCTQKVKTWHASSWKLQPITSLPPLSPTPLRRNWRHTLNASQSRRGLRFIYHNLAPYHDFFYSGSAASWCLQYPF